MNFDDDVRKEYLLQMIGGDNSPLSNLVDLVDQNFITWLIIKGYAIPTPELVKPRPRSVFRANTPVYLTELGRLWLSNPDTPPVDSKKSETLEDWIIGYLQGVYNKTEDVTLRSQFAGFRTVVNIHEHITDVMNIQIDYTSVSSKVNEMFLNGQIEQSATWGVATYRYIPTTPADSATLFKSDAYSVFASTDGNGYHVVNVKTGERWQSNVPLEQANLVARSLTHHTPQADSMIGELPDYIAVKLPQGGWGVKNTYTNEYMGMDKWGYLIDAKSLTEYEAKESAFKLDTHHIPPADSTEAALQAIEDAREGMGYGESMIAEVYTNVLSVGGEMAAVISSDNRIIYENPSTTVILDVTKAINTETQRLRADNARLQAALTSANKAAAENIDTANKLRARVAELTGELARLQDFVSDCAVIGDAGHGYDYMEGLKQRAKDILPTLKQFTD